jgi:general secretion pathway protein M
MIMSLSLPVRRLLAVALLVALLSFAWSAVIEPLIDYVAAKQAEIRRLEAVLAHGGFSEHDIDALQAEMAAMKQRRDTVGGFIEGSNISIAAAQLQDRLGKTVAAAGGEVRSTQILPARDEGDYRRITLRGQIMAPLAAVQGTVYVLEATAPYLFFDRIEVNSRLSTLAAANADANPVLDVHFDLSGFMRIKP